MPSNCKERETDNSLRHKVAQLNCKFEPRTQNERCKETLLETNHSESRQCEARSTLSCVIPVYTRHPFAAGYAYEQTESKEKHLRAWFQLRDFRTIDSRSSWAASCPSTTQPWKHFQNIIFLLIPFSAASTQYPTILRSHSSVSLRKF